METYALLLGSVLLAILNSALLHRYGNRGLDNAGDILLFNGATSLIWILVILIAGGSFSVPSAITVAAGVGYGAVTAGFLLSKMLALASGNMSVTVMLGCSSLMVPTILGSLIWQEQVTVGQAIGLALLLIAMALSMDRSGGGETKPRWKLYCALFFLFSGLSGLVFKFHQNSPGKAETGELLLIGSATSAVLLILAAHGLNRRAGAPRPKLIRAAWKYAVICGICSCGYNWLNVHLTGVLPSVIFFPVFNGGVILGSSVMGRLCFREKLTRLQIAGLFAGMLALLLIGKVFS